jgi:hypothetical protein
MANPGEFLYDLDQWLVIGILLVLMFAGEEIGYRFGRRRRDDYDADGRSNFSNLQVGLFGLFGLLLAFTFNMAQSRYEARREVIVNEANAIGTASLRADLVAEPARGEIRALLRDYVDRRIAPPGIRLADLRRQIAESEAIQTRLWARAAAAAVATPTPAAALLVPAVNDVIDLHGKRVAASRAHVPEAAIVLVIAFALGAALITGFRNGVGHRHARLPSAAFLVTVTAVIGVIIDLDRPQRGLISLDQRPLIELRASLHAAP